jgi:hypothetical protein
MILFHSLLVCPCVMIAFPIWQLFIILYNIFLVSFFAWIFFLSVLFFLYVCSISLRSARRNTKQLTPKNRTENPPRPQRYVIHQYWVAILTYRRNMQRRKTIRKTPKQRRKWVIYHKRGATKFITSAVYFTTFSVYLYYTADGGTISEWWIRKDLEGNRCDQISIAVLHLPPVSYSSSSISLSCDRSIASSKVLERDCPGKVVMW